MRDAIVFGDTTVSMRRARLTDIDMDIPGPKTGRVLSTQWRIYLTRAGRERVHLALPTEAQADAAMDGIKANADAWAAALTQQGEGHAN